MSLDATQSEGPKLESLTRHLAECPPDFLRPPQVVGGREVGGTEEVGGRGEIRVSAVVFDLLDELGVPPDPGVLASFVSGHANRLRLVAVTCWLLHAPWFRESLGDARRRAPALLEDGLTALAGQVDAELFVNDPDRREELVRYVLQQLSLRPGGETELQAKDRLNTLDSVERARVVAKSRSAVARAKRIREELRRAAAEAAAAKVSRE